MTEQTHAGITTTGVTAVKEDLEGRGAAFELVEHEETMRASAEARAVGWPPEAVAKTVVLQDGSLYLLVVIPASERLDLRKVRDLLGATRHLRLATEAEIERDFPGLEVGATPPIGPMLPSAEIIDMRLLEHARILCAAGDHRHGLFIAPSELVRLTDARVADVCEDA